MYWKEYNPHPQKKNVGDCVKRALTKATGFDYNDVKNQLNRIKREINGEAFNDPRVYEEFLRRNKFVKVSFPTVKGKPRMTVKKLCQKANDNEVYVCRCARHLVCVSDNHYWDTWDSGDKCVYVAWVKAV